MPRRKQRKVSPIQEQEERSRSTSPELGFQDTSNCPAENVVKQPITPKKRGPPIRTDEANIIAYMEEKITNTFETAYNLTCETAGNKYASEMLLAAFKKIGVRNAAAKERLKTVFFEKFLYRLSFMVESLTLLENRLKVFRFLAKFSANQFWKGTPDFIDCLTEFCETLSFCEDAAVRQNICTIVGFVLKELRNGSSTENEVDTTRIKRKLYAVMLDRQLDKIVAVRAEVIKSVAEIQDDEIPNDFVEALERSPKDVILMGFRDVAVDCRLTAIFALNTVIPSHCDYLIELACSDPICKVRAAAVRQISRIRPTFLTEKQRMVLLRGIIFDDDPSIMETVCTTLIPEWISFVHREQQRKNKRKSGVLSRRGAGRVEIKQEVNDDLSDAHQIKSDHGMGAAAQGFLAMMDFCDAPEAELIARTVLFTIFDVIREQLQMADKNLTHFVSSLVNDNTFPEVLSTHNYRNFLDERLSRTDHAQYAFFWRVLMEYCCDRAAAEPERIECIYMLAPPIPSMDEWRRLLLHLLRDKSLSKELTDCIMIDLAETFFDGKPDQFLVAICDVTAEAIRLSEETDENHEPLSTPKALKAIDDQCQPDTNNMRYCIQLIHSMLRTGLFDKFTVLLRKLYDEIIVRCFSSVNTKVRTWAIEVAAILATLEESLVREVLSKAEDALKDGDEDVKLSATNIITDLIAVYGYRNILKRREDRAPEADQPRFFVDFLLDVIKNKSSSPALAFKSCECAAKIVLLESLSREEFPSDEIIVALIFRKNQLVMIEAFHRLMAQIRSDYETNVYVNLEIDAALSLVIGCTQYHILKGAPDKEKGPVQPIFLRELLDYQLKHPDDVCSSLYWQTAAALDLEQFPVSDLEEAEKQALSLIEKFVRCVENAIHAGSFKDVEDAERGDCLTELRTSRTGRPGTARGRRRTPRTVPNTPIGSARTVSSRKKTASTVKKSTQQVLTGNRTPSPPPLATSLVTPIARTRPVLSRSAKATAATKTRRWLFEQNE
ncbi:unnamed protein product [Nippostrongylus brasiliensis]|uniref:Cnd3 domain-containing protein n=1 Tax=Nippostrongylus brasiliensis TaxID=27835 RepID=A0A158R2V4_NIPBR|nr:unnamed protein product [Nippostrongylus brasiliensis]